MAFFFLFIYLDYLLYLRTRLCNKEEGKHEFF